MTSTCGGRSALGAQRVALLDPEAVLLVDDDQAEVGELARPPGCRAWVPTTMPARRLGDVGARLPAGGGLMRAGQQRHPGAVGGAVELAGAAERAEQRGDAAGVLGGEHLGGREQRGLPAGVDDLRPSPAARRRSCPSRPRPAAAGASGAPAARSAASSSPTARWPVGEGERQRGVERRRAGRRGAAAGRRPGSSAAARRRPASTSCRTSASSHFSRSVARSTSAGEVGRWIVEQRRGQREQAVAVAQLLRAAGRAPGHRAAARVQEQLDRLLDHPAGDLLARRVDRDERPGPVLVVVPGEQVARRGGRTAVALAVLAHRAGEQAPAPVLELAVPVVEEDQLHGLRRRRRW